MVQQYTPLWKCVSRRPLLIAAVRGAPSLELDAVAGHFPTVSVVASSKVDDVVVFFFPWKDLVELCKAAV